MVPVNSGTTNNLNGAYLLDSGPGFVVGDAGTIVKTTDAGATWSRSHRELRTPYTMFICSIPMKESLLASSGLILRTTDGGAGWQRVASGVKDSLRSVSFSGVNGICGGDSQIFFTRLTQELRGRSARLDSLAAVSRARRC